MIDVIKIQASNDFGANSLYVWFVIENTSDNLDNYIFDIYKSNHLTQPYTLLVSDIKDFQFLDTSVNLYDTAIDYYYKVKVTDKATGEFYMSEVFGQYKGAPIDNHAAAILEIHNIYLDRIITMKMWLLKRKRFGQLCTCFDDIRRRANPINCELCYGTKFVGGYYDPYEVGVNGLNPTNMHEKFSVSDVAEEMAPQQVWASNYPYLQVNDILVDKDSGDCYIIMGTQLSNMKGYLLRQSLQIQRLPRSNIVYKLPSFKL